VFFSSILYTASTASNAGVHDYYVATYSAYHQEEDLAKFGYNRNMKVKTFKHPSILLAIGTET
jgi:DMSO/TMAO reductase YedYZ molybdopterin-dependent catalytic subunit